MGRLIVPDDLWQAVEPLLPPHKTMGRPRIPDRAVLSGILFILRSGTPWEHLPAECGFGTGMTCWRRLKEWQQAGVWDRLHRVLLERLAEADKLDWSRASLDAGTVPAPGGAQKPGRTRRTGANRARSGTWWSTGKAFRLP